MVRVTRSHKIAVAEDHSELGSQISLPESPALAHGPLVELINKNEVAMTVDDYEVEQELKDLKGAYKTAIGVKKIKKGKNKNKGKTDGQDVGDHHAVGEDQQPAAVSLAAEDARKILCSDEDEPPELHDRPAAPPSPATRATRQQSAKTQAGQFEYKDFITAYPYHGTRGPPLNFISSVNSPLYGHSIGAWVADNYASTWVTQANNIGHTAAQNQETQENSFLPQGSSTDRDSGVEMLLIHEEATIAPTPEEVVEANQAKELTLKVADAQDKSSMDQTAIPSPARSLTRIEDTVEALDQLEDALEALDEMALAQALVSPEKKKKLCPAATIRQVKSAMENRPHEREQSLGLKKALNPVRVKASTMGRRTVNPTLEPKSKADESLALKEARSKSSLGAANKSSSAAEAHQVRAPAARKSIRRPASLLPPKQAVKTAKPVTVPNFELPGEAVARKLKEKREARLAQRESSEDSFATAVTTSSRTPTIRSTKPLTKPNFELPGEALSRRKREAQEARIQALEEEERKRREFKAKPPRNTIAPETLPRDTAASRARKSQIGVSEGGAGESAKAYGSLGKRNSFVGSHRPSILATRLANVSAPRAPGAFAPNTARKVSASCGSSMTGLSVQRPVSASEQKRGSRELYSRDMKALVDVEKEKREREVALKKSREEAAERGRQASREWAEKHKDKKALAGDQGLAPGFGPGGQMGLK